ncbi:hypothetical protein BGZ65_006448 [Modicella reniformis]|uniref:Pentatricopeptide repeat-containing protein-mitochondrial domain-containing protein n=1 Tax=Modicella reniformis TaxID=1440133 RepID=A0A9P6JN57_9FUNG|nr:hypothetical protein BGZ65_006448 [Modicella reniformis]
MAATPQPLVYPSQPIARLSTSATSRTIGTMTLDDFEGDDTVDEKQHSKTTSDDLASPFLDLTIIPSEPIKAFRDLFEQIRYSNNPDDHEKLLSAYRTLADDPDLLAQLQPIDFMRAMNSCRDLLHVIPKMRRILFEDVNKTAHRDIPDLYHILLKTYIKLSDFKSCANLLHEMRNRNIKYNVFTYHIILDMCKHQNKSRDAIETLKEMRRDNIEITASTYLIMMTICARTKNKDLATEYFDEMSVKNINAEVVHYNALLNAYAHAKDLAGAREVFQMLEADGIPADPYTYAALIKALMNSRKTDEAHIIVKGLAARGINPNVKILAALGKEPTDILDRCIMSGVEVTQHDFNMLIIQALKANKFTQVQILLDQMHKQGHRPNVFTFTAMVDADIKMGKYQEAKDIFLAMQQANIQPDVIAYSAMISGALSQSTLQESLGILKDMVDDGLLPNLHTFNSLLSASVGEIGIEGFRTIRQTMLGLRVRPDTRTFNAFLSAYALQGNMDEMLRTLNDMKECKVKPDVLTYSILISGYLQNGDLRFAMEWYYKMIKGGFRPAAFLLNNLMAALHGSGEGQQVAMMWHEIHRMELQKDEQTFEIALEACQKYGLHDVRAQVEEELKNFLAARFRAEQYKLK